MSSSSFDYENVHSILLRECALVLSSGPTTERMLAERLRTLLAFLGSEDVQRALEHDSEKIKKILPARYIVLDTMTTVLKANRTRKPEKVPSRRAASKETDDIALRCISCCLEKLNTRRSLWKDSSRFWKILDVVVCTLTGSNADMKSSSADEATKMSCVNALASLFSHKHYEQDLFRLTKDSQNSKLRIGHVISVLLSIAETYHEGCLTLRIRALDVIEMLCRALCDSLVEGTAQSGCRSFLPGISSCLCRLLRPTVTASSRLMISALLVWATVLSSSLSIGDQVSELEDDSDNNNNDDESCDDTSSIQTRLENMLMLRGKDKSSSSSPAPTTSSPLQQYLENTSKHVLERAKMVVPVVAHHKNWRARAAAVKFATRVLCIDDMQEAPRCLSQSAVQLLGPPLIEVILALRQDSHKEVSSLAARSFESVQRYLETKWQSLVPIIQDRLRSTVLSLPRVARRQRSGNEMQLEASLRLLQGHLELVRTQGGTLPLQSIVSSLLSVLECDLSLRKGGRIGVALESSSFYRVPFRYMRRNATIDAVSDVCIELSHVASMRDEFPNLVEEVLSSLNQDAIPTLWAPSLYILSRIFVLKTTSSRLRTLTPYIADTLLESRHWKSSTSAAELIQSSTRPVMEADRNALVIALACETIASIGRSAANGNGVFELLLLRVLYPLLERVKDPHPIVRQAASATLDILAVSGKHKSTEHLLKANLDYLVDALLARLRYLSLYPRTPSVLTVLWKHVDTAALQPLLRDCARHSLRRLRQDSSRNEPHTLDLLRLLSVIAHVIYSRCHDDDDEDQDQLDQKKEKSFLQVLEDIKSRNINEDKIKDTKTRTNSITKEELATSLELQSLAKDIAEVCLHFVGVDSPLSLHLESCRALCNAILAVCIFECRFEKILNNEEERQNVLLPLVHHTWPVILECFRRCSEKVILFSSSLKMDEEYDAASFVLSSDVLRAALEVLRTSAEVSGSFICSRFQKEMWPHLRRIVMYCTSTSSSSSSSSDKTIKLEKTWDRRDALLKNLLKTISKVLCVIAVNGDNDNKTRRRRVNIRDMVVDMGSIFFPFLSSKQYSIQIQELAFDVWRQLLLHDSDAVWYKLFTYASPKLRVLNHSKQHFEALSYDTLRILPPRVIALEKEDNSYNQVQEYCENVDKLLEYEASEIVEDDWHPGSF